MTNSLLATSPMTALEQKILAKTLREQGHTYTEIGKILGRAGTVIWRWLNPERAAESNKTTGRHYRKRNNRALVDCPKGQKFPYEGKPCEHPKEAPNSRQGDHHAK